MNRCLYCRQPTKPSKRGGSNDFCSPFHENLWNAKSEALQSAVPPVDLILESSSSDDSEGAEPSQSGARRRWTVERTDARQSVIGATVRVVGEIRSSEDLVIYGSVEGTVELTQRATSTMSSEPNRQKPAKLTIAGSASGMLVAPEIEVLAGSVVTGDLVSLNLSIQAGALLNARVRTNAADAKPEGATLAARAGA